MTVLLPSARRRSRFLFDWSAAACLAASEQSLDAITGQAATFSRTSIKTAFDANGILRTVPHSLPAFQWSTDPVSGLSTPGVLLEDTRTNVALWNRDLSNAAWTKTNTTAVKTQTGIDGVASSASLLTATAANGTCLQAIVLASSARYQSAYVKRVTGSGVVNMTTDNGATWTAVTVTSAWTRVTIPTQTLVNPTVGFRIVTNADAIAIDYVQNENGVLQTSPIATTTLAVARSADALSFAFSDLPRALTIYAKIVDAGTAFNEAVDRGILDLGGNGSNPRFLLYHNATTFAAYHSLGSNSDIATAVTAGSTLEHRGVMNANGSTAAGLSINGATEVTSSNAATLTLEAAWNSANLYFNRFSAGTIGFASFQSVRIAAGVQTMAFMRGG